MRVKKTKRGRPSGEQSKLSKNVIISNADILLRKESKFPSIRKLAGKLEVDAMAIYHYFPNKAALLEAVTVSLMESIYEPSANKDWKNNLIGLCKSYLELLCDYSDLLETILSMNSDGPAQVFTERFNKTLAPLELDRETLQNSLHIIADYLHGFALAMRCTPQSSSLSADQMDGPLSLLIKTLEIESNAS